MSRVRPTFKPRASAVSASEMYQALAIQQSKFGAHGYQNLGQNTDMGRSPASSYAPNSNVPPERAPGTGTSQSSHWYNTSGPSRVAHENPPPGLPGSSRATEQMDTDGPRDLSQPPEGNAAASSTPSLPFPRTIPSQFMNQRDYIRHLETQVQASEIRIRDVEGQLEERKSEAEELLKTVENLNRSDPSIRQGRRQGNRPPEINALQKVVRQYCEYLMDLRPNAASVTHKTPLPAPPENPDHILPTLVRPMRIAYLQARGHPYNQVLSDIFAEALLKEEAWKCMQLTAVDIPFIKDTFLVHVLGHLRNLWKAQVTPPSLHSRVAKNAKESRKKRRRDLAKARLATARLYMPEHARIVERYGGDGASSDEEMDTPNEYRVVQKDWRSPDAVRLFHILDDLLLASRSKQKQGRPPRKRIHPDVVVDAQWNCVDAVKGLPRNGYSAEWLTKMPPLRKKTFAIDEDAYDFTIPEDLSDPAMTG